jgi:N4-gp56 family major capsid protein
MQLNASATGNDYLFSVTEFVNKEMADRIRPDVFYSKQLLDTIRYDADKYIYYRYADSAPIEEKAGELVLRRWTPLQAHTKPLEEGVPPKSDKGTVQKYTMKAHQYGRYMEFSDRVDFKMVDPVVAMYAKEYSIVAIETLDLLARETLMTNSSIYFAGITGSTSPDLQGVAIDYAFLDGLASDISISNIHATMKPKLDDLRICVMIMKRNWIKPRQNGNFHVICSPEFTFDMVDDPRVEKYMTINQTTKTLYDGSVLVPMFGMEFYETDLVPKTSRHISINADTQESYESCYTVDDATHKVVVTAVAENYTGYLYDGPNTDNKPYATNTRLLNTGMATSYVEDFKLETENEIKFHHIFILGDKALYRTGRKGEDSAKMYTKPLGSSGVLDPIDQRQSIGFKINSVGFAVIDPKAVMDYICWPTMEM